MGENKGGVVCWVWHPAGRRFVRMRGRREKTCASNEGSGLDAGRSRAATSGGTPDHTVPPGASIA